MGRRGEPLILPLLMLLVTPCTDWYLVFTGAARGNLAVSTALLPVNFVLQLLLLPVYLQFLAGAALSFEWREIRPSPWPSPSPRFPVNP